MSEEQAQPKIEKPKKEKKPKPIVEEREELDTADLIPETKKMDPNKDYCRNCHDQGRLVEVRKGQDQCPSCGEELDWK